MKKIIGYHHEIKAILNPIKDQIKKIHVENPGYNNEELHVYFYDGRKEVMKFINEHWDFVENE